MRRIRKITAALRTTWCQLMHDAPMWPRKTYRCRVCHVEHVTPWALTDVEKMRMEQRLAKAHIAQGEGFPAVLGAFDWMAEELLTEAKSR